MTNWDTLLPQADVMESDDKVQASLDQLTTLAKEFDKLWRGRRQSDS